MKILQTLKTMSRIVPIAVALAVLAMPAPADAQRRRGDPPDRAQMEQRMRAMMGRMMQERLGLTEEEEARLSEVVESFDDQRRELFTREIETRRRVEELVQGAGDEAEARALLELQAQLRLEEAELFRAEQEALLEILSPAQVLELRDLREDLGRRIRALRGGGGPDGDRNRFRGPGPDGRIGAYWIPWGPRPLL